jgi:glutathione S-transferase
MPYNEFEFLSCTTGFMISTDNDNNKNMSDTQSALPILYSFRRCPYAMRARMAIKYSGCAVYLREVALKDKPDALLKSSSKGTVPVLVLPDGSVIDESQDIIRWALEKNDPEQWIPTQDNALHPLIQQLINLNDSSFKDDLYHYKYADRFPEQSAEYYRAQGELFLMRLEDHLSHYTFLLDNKITKADISIFPFIRQFAHVDIEWFEQAPYPRLQTWLNYFIQSDLFNSVMEKYPQWHEDHNPTLF